MKRISNPLPVYSLFLWPFIMIAFVIWAFLRVQSGDPNGLWYIGILAGVVIYRRVFLNPVLVFEIPGGLLVKRSRESEEIAFEQIGLVEIRGRSVTVTTTHPKFPSFSFVPSDVSLLSTGRSRQEGLEQFVTEFRLKLGRSR